ncbi:MAG: cyanate hydratase [Thermoproteota archaeon]|nr:cyanate hydratase [Thermoproteota archaeon]
MTTTEIVSTQADRQAVLANVRAKMKEKGVTYTKLADTVGKDPMFIAAALHGQQKLSFTDVDKMVNTLGLDGEAKKSLLAYPVRTEFPSTTDPFKYRLLEVIGVYGDAMREVFNELFVDKTGRGGDGIMSAIDFSIKLERITGSHGEPRLRITMDGKYLEYKEF